MYNKDFFIEEFKRLGLLPTDTVFVHSSYKKIAGSIGVEGGPQTILNAFIEYFGEKGLVIFPTLTWKMGFLFNENGNFRAPWDKEIDGFYQYGTHFDVHTSSCKDIGILPELFRQQHGVIRSLSPTHSVAAFGADSKEFCANHINAKTPFREDTPWDRLYSRNTKFLFLGTGLSCNTYLHFAEELANVPNLLIGYNWNYSVTDYDGTTHNISIKRHEAGHSHYYSKMETEFLQNGIAERVTFGSAPTHIVDGVKELDYILKRLKECPELFTHEYNSQHK